MQLIPNIITNVDEIVSLAEKHRDKFVFRGQIGDRPQLDTFYVVYDDDKLVINKFYSMFGNRNTDECREINDAIYKTLDIDKLGGVKPDTWVLNRYEPGNFLSRHRDTFGRYWQFNLIFLRSDKPHFKYYENEDDKVGKLFKEEPGAYLSMPITVEHEVTEIEPDEKDRYSLVLIWE